MFDTVLIISLECIPDRRKNAIIECEKIGFKNIIIIDAIDGNLLNIDKHIACTMSHLKALNYIIANNIENFVIVEDDIKFVSKNVWDDTINKLTLDENWDILLLGYFGLCDYNKKYHIAEKILFNLPFVGNGLLKNKNSKQVNSNIFIPESFLGLHCYAVNKKNITQIRDILDKKFNLPDVILNLHSDKINIYAVNPCLAYQDIGRFNSTLTKKSILEPLFNVFNCGNVPLGWRLSCYGEKINGYSITGFTYVYLLIIIIIICVICYHKKRIYQTLY